MSEGEQLFRTLLLIYLSGCLLWVNRRTALFVSWFGRKWKTIVADYRWGNLSGRVYLLNPFPPLGFMFVSRLMSVSFSPTNIVSYNIQTIGNSGRPPQAERIAPIESSTKFSRIGSELLVDEKPFCDIGDIETAHKLVVLFNKIKGRSIAVRELAIAKFWRERLDIRRTKKQIRAVLEASHLVRLVGSLSFILTFVIIPLVSFRYGVGLAVLLGAAVLFVSAAATCLVYLSAHRRYYPAFKGGVWGDLAKMLLCPLIALRASDLIMEKLSARLDALPLALLLLRDTNREMFLTEYLADLAAPDVSGDISDAVRTTCLWQNQEILKIGLSMIPRLNRYTHAGCSPAS